MTTNEILEMARAADGKRRDRIITSNDIERFQNIFAEHKDDPDAKIIRVYSGQGFVPNAYQWRVLISYIQATRSETGEWVIRVSSGDAKRSYGKGALATVNGRAV